MPRPHLCLVNSLRTWGGAEIWFLETARGLRERGHQVSLVAQPDSELCARARAAGVPVQAVPIRFDGAPWTLARLTRHLRRTGVTALLANLTKDLKAAAVAGRLAGVRTILASRESDFPLKSKPYYRWYFSRLATGMLVNSRATRQTMLGSAPWLDPERVHLLYKGIDLQKFRPDDAGAHTDSRVELTVGFAGQLIERKGLGTLMRAWSRLEAHHPEARLRLAGTGPLRGALDSWRQDLRHPDHVAILGQVEDMPAFYRACRLLVMPSLCEGFGLAAAEALACGVPVVATRTSSLPEIVHHRESGLLVPVADADALRQAMARLLDDGDEAHRLGLAGRRHVVQNFDRQDTLDRLAELTGLNGPTGPTR